MSKLPAINLWQSYSNVHCPRTVVLKCTWGHLCQDNIRWCTGRDITWAHSIIRRVQYSNQLEITKSLVSKSWTPQSFESSSSVWDCHKHRGVAIRLYPLISYNIEQGVTSPTDLQLKKAMDKIKEEHHTIMFFAKADRQKYSKLLEQMEKALLQIKDPHVRSVAEACRILADWKDSLWQ